MFYKLIFCFCCFLAIFNPFICAQIPADSSRMQRDSLPLDSLDEDINRPLGDTTTIWTRVDEREIWQRVDTSLQYFEQLNPTWNANLPDFCLNLGAWGTPLVQRVFTLRPRGGFWLGLEAYSPYQLQPEQLKWYKIGQNRPFTELFYSQVNQKNGFVRASFAHQIRPRVYYMLHFNINNAFGFYLRQKARHQNLAVSLRLFSKNMRYEARPTYQNYNAEITENGGIVDMNEVAGAATLDLGDLPVQLTNAEYLIETNSFAFAHYWHQKGVDSSLSANGKYRLSQNFAFSTQKYKYFDNNILAARDYYDSLNLNRRGIRQYAGLKTWIHSVGILLPLGDDLQNAPFLIDLNLTQQFFVYNQEVKQTIIPNFFAKGQIYNNPQATKTALMLQAEAQLAQNNRFLDIFTRFSIGYKFNTWLNLQFEGLFQRYQPSQLAQQLFVSRQPLWNNPNFTQQNELMGKVSLDLPVLKLKLWAENQIVGQFIYSDTNRIVRQDAATNNILQLGICHKLKLKNVAWENKAIFQRINSPNNTIRLPVWNVYSQLYWQFRPYSTLLLRTGATVRYWSAYQNNEYFPLTQQFYLQNRNSIPSYPIVDYFVSVKIWQAKIFVNIENILQPFIQTTFFTAPYYPQANLLIRFGVYWSLFD